MTVGRLLLAVAGGGGGFAVPQPSVVELAAAPDGGWIWYTSPCAVYHDGLVHFGYTRGDNGHDELRTYDEALDTTSGPTDIGEVQDDDHANPSLLVRGDERVMAFFSAHNGSGEYHVISTDPNDIGAIGAWQNLDATIGLSSYTYTQVIGLPGAIYLIFRHSPGPDNVTQWYWIVSEDDGATWGDLTLLLSQANRAPYLKAVPNGDDRIDFVATNANPAANPASVYHFYYQGGTFHKSDGTTLTLPATQANMTQVYDGSTVPAALEDIGIGTDGHPRIGFTRYVGVGTDHRADHARWTGSAWSVNEMAATGPGIDAEGYYSGGIAFDPVDADIVYAGVEVSGTYEMHRFRTTDDGETFTETALTTASGAKQFRPVPVRNGHGGGLRVLWMAGSYTDQNDWNCGTRGLVA